MGSRVFSSFFDFFGVDSTWPSWVTLAGVVGAVFFGDSWMVLASVRGGEASLFSVFNTPTFSTSNGLWLKEKITASEGPALGFFFLVDEDVVAPCQVEICSDECSCIDVFINRQCESLLDVADSRGLEVLRGG